MAGRMKALLLALDTAGDTLSYALHDGTALLAEHSWRAARQPTTQLAAAVAGSLAECGGAAALSALAVSLGPGSYTGLRSGIALAQGLAEAHGLPLIGVGAHEALLASCRPHPGRLWVIVPAGRGRYFVRAYRGEGGRWRAAGPLLQATAEELRGQLAAGDGLLGEWEPGADEAFADLPLYRYPPAARLRRAGFLAERAGARLQETLAAGEDPRRTFPPEAIRPLYSAELLADKSVGEEAR